MKESFEKFIGECLCQNSTLTTVLRKKSTNMAKKGKKMSPIKTKMDITVNALLEDVIHNKARVCFPGELITILFIATEITTAS